jgi:hypothetical protein
MARVHGQAAQLAQTNYVSGTNERYHLISTTGQCGAQRRCATAPASVNSRALNAFPMEPFRGHPDKPCEAPQRTPLHGIARGQRGSLPRRGVLSGGGVTYVEGHRTADLTDYSRCCPTGWVMNFEDESTWLLHRVVRTILRYVKDPRAESGLRELIAEAEQRLEQLEAMRRTKAPNELKAAN